jgi:propionate CoA-transferase
MSDSRGKLCSARDAVARDQPVRYLTKRAVFELTGAGLRLTEIAPGIDLQRDVPDRMAFAPAVADVLKIMSQGLFQTPCATGLADDLGRAKAGR